MDRIGLILSDLHIGSMWSMWPKDLRLSNGTLPILNQGQDYLLECYEDLKERVPKRLDFLFLGGDLVEGKNSAEEGAWLTESHPSWQTRAAIEILEPLVDRAKYVYVIGGSKYHVGRGFEFEESLAQHLHSEQNAFGGFVWPWLNISVDGVHLDISHRQSVMMRYKSTPLEREIQFSNNIIPDIKEDCDAIYRAHAHMYVDLNVDGQVSVSLPPWKLPDYFAQTTVSPNRTISRLFGAVLVTIKPDIKAAGEPNAGEYVLNKFLSYRNPGIKVETLGGSDEAKAKANICFRGLGQRDKRRTRKR